VPADHCRIAVLAGHCTFSASPYSGLLFYEQSAGRLTLNQ
jgi:hypothetical protein